MIICNMKRTYFLKMLSSTTILFNRVSGVNIFKDLEILLPNMFTEESGDFLLQDIIMKLISRYCNLLNLVFLSFF